MPRTRPITPHTIFHMICGVDYHWSPLYFQKLVCTGLSHRPKLYSTWHSEQCAFWGSSVRNAHVHCTLPIIRTQEALCTYLWPVSQGSMLCPPSFLMKMYILLRYKITFLLQRGLFTYSYVQSRFFSYSPPTHAQKRKFWIALASIINHDREEALIIPLAPY